MYACYPSQHGSGANSNRAFLGKVSEVFLGAFCVFFFFLMFPSSIVNKSNLSIHSGF